MDTIYVSVRPEETRMGLVEDDRLREYAVERRHSDNLVGNVYREVTFFSTLYRFWTTLFRLASVPVVSSRLPCTA